MSGQSRQSEDPYIQQILDVDTLSTASKKQYKDKLGTIKKITRKEIEWIIQNPKQTFKTICASYSKPQTIGSFLASILAIFKHIPNVKESKLDKYKTYRLFYDQVYKEIEQKYRSGVASERQKKGFVDWLTILDKRNQLAESSYASREHLLLSMYTYVKPVRQDFYNLKIYDKMPDTEEKKKEGNYIVLPQSKGDSFLVLNEYKSSKASFNKQFKKELCAELVAIIKKSLEMNPRSYLFVDSDGNPYMIDNSYIQQINRLLGKIFGKPVTVCLLRNAFIIYRRSLNLTAGEEEDDAKEMMHSDKVHNRYRFAVYSNK
jgi:hypothetical protein